MSEYRVYIEPLPWNDVVRVHMQKHLGISQKVYLTMENGKVIANTIGRCEPAPEGSHFLELPDDVFDSLKEGIIKYVENQGGAPTQQSLRGELKRLEDEVKWLREIIKSKV